MLLFFFIIFIFGTDQKIESIKYKVSEIESLSSYFTGSFEYFSDEHDGQAKSWGQI